jgi:hypothetical protein
MIFPTHKYIERGKTDTLNTQIHREVKPIYSTHKHIERGKTDMLKTQINRKR